MFVTVMKEGIEWNGIKSHVNGIKSHGGGAVIRNKYSFLTSSAYIRYFTENATALSTQQLLILDLCIVSLSVYVYVAAYPIPSSSKSTTLLSDKKLGKSFSNRTTS